MASSATEGPLENCPFCGFHPESEYHLLVHMELHHSENDTSPFVAQDGASATSAVTEADTSYIDCLRCGEQVTSAEFGDHSEFHDAEEDDDEAPSETAADSVAQPNNHTNGYHSPYGNSRSDVPEVVRKYGYKSTERRTTEVKNRQSGATDRWKNLLKLPSATRKRVVDDSSTGGHRSRKRLGKEELGKYAHEDTMPGWLVTLLRQKGQIIQGHIVPVLANLLRVSQSTEYAYLCNPAVDHVSKLRREGGFCGYRNIQMLSSYIIGARAEGAHHFDGRLPSVFDIQEYIENAWDRGINAQGRVETGGVRGTRKYIGTPEAQAVFLSLNIPCDAQGFKDQRPGNAETRLLQHIEQYFEEGNFDPAEKVRCTRLPPIYFQHRGHSLTIVGFEKKRNGSSELIVFDPMFHDPDSIKNLLDSRQVRATSSDALLKLYRRGNKYLKRFNEFEILKLKSRLPDAETEEQAEMGNYWVPEPGAQAHEH
ncbi:putative Peptidase family C78-domain-containing protein [Seiridium unicorne]|uniref:Peptidase family C78-domain-containing protein n=1 Tax=Seiridium unicorne TaxID=138068 RepID=A0ABR2VI00_9PEZI